MDAAYVGIDHDGALLSCVSVVDGVVEESFSTHVAIEVSGANPPNIAVFETGQRRFRTRDEDGLREFAATPAEDAAVHRVRTLQALVDRPALATGRPLKVALGLPVRKFFKDLEKGIPDTEYQRHWLSEQEIAVVREPVPAAVNVVTRNVASRGIAAYFDWTRDDLGQARSDRSRMVTAVLDVGSRDTSLLTFNGDQLKTEQSTVLSIGYLPLLEGLNARLQRDFGVPSVRTRALLSILMEGRFHVRGEPHDAMPLLADSARQLAGDLLEVMTGLSVNAEDVVVVGPAANVIATSLLERSFDVQVPESPAFANARGMTKFLRGAAA